MMNVKANNKNAGFTLIEMAIVLVIIGLIIGAVLKGQDLIQNARAKKFVNFVRAAEVGQWTYLDRKGVFAGDSNSDGVIDASPSFTGFENAPESTLVLGSFSYDIFYGSDSNSTNYRNYIAVCPKTGSTFEEDELLFLESLDTAIDGVSNGTDGRVVGTTVDISSNGTVNINNTSDYAATTASIVYYFDKK